MSAECCNAGPWTGFTKAELEPMLRQAQQAYFDLSVGGKGEVFSYTQGDGTKSVTYTRTNVAQLMALIQSLKQALGLPCSRRAPIGFTFPGR